MVKPLYEFNDVWRQRIIRMHLETPRGGQVTGPIEGAYGEVYSILLNDPGRTRIAAKSPRIKRFGSLERARSGVEQVLHELEKTHQVFKVPWINRFFDVQIIHGWPFILSRYRDGSLQDLIANPLAWSLEDRLASLIQIVRALRLTRDRGIAAHQDLKPGNVFFDDLSRQGVPKASRGMHFHMFVGDFGLADAFRDFGRNSGSRPYMAPEQFSSSPIEPAGLASFDIFALGVMAFEVLTDGKHPMGIATADIWPRRVGVPQKWNRESTWREWAAAPDKSRYINDSPLPIGVGDLILASLSANPTDRPPLEDFENQLWNVLGRLDAETHAGLRMQIDYFEDSSSGDGDWPHMEQRLSELRQFYATL